ncbi:MAG TPA: hypothetical protein VFZ41_05690 [Solirubrobacterales bacterium]
MRRIACIGALATILLGAGLAQAELFQRGNLRLNFTGRFTPKTLPRDHAAPVRVQFSGSLASVDGSRPPELRRLSIGVNRYGRVFTRGLPTCEPGQLQSTTSADAIARCGRALVGRGRFRANVDFSNAEFPVEGRTLAFNARKGRRPVLLLHIYGSRPVTNTIVLTFRILRPQRGGFGTVFTATIPSIASDLGYVSELSLHFDRRFRFGGKPRSYLSARCAAPPGFGGGPFTFIRGKFVFSNGQVFDTRLTRFCRVR